MWSTGVALVVTGWLSASVAVAAADSLVYVRGGVPYISATDDIDTVLSPTALTSLQPSDFEMIDGGTRVNFHAQNCTRTPITQ